MRPTQQTTPRVRTTGGPRGPEWTIEVRALLAENQYPGAHEYEREQRADIDELPEQLQRQQAGCERHGHAGEDRRQIRRAILRMHGAGPFAEQAVARHRVEDA